MIKFLSISDVLMILENQIRNYGGIYGVRDLNLLNSALYMPQSSFDGEYLHKTIPEMAAAYTYHICQNHPFTDGNKRTALAASLVFLDLNGYTINCDDKELYGVIMGVANEKINKKELIKFYKQVVFSF
ncbi:MAG: type II toxin-antitoxin system death-on-curing family toxin [Campylobacteraceae bacterium]|jgi:death-on-curing protein|nr:type II toxin-antitoxin system death-on-curing family toxin [Campylobacteraceae bacterium]